MKIAASLGVIAALAIVTVRDASAVEPLAQVIASVPNRLNPIAVDSPLLPPLERVLGADQQFWIKVGPPDASLSISLVEPRGKDKTPRGTILVLHGVFDRSAVMLPAARALAEAGYRAVLADLRGRGRSTGKYLTFGLQEAKDLKQVVDELEKRGLLAGSLGVYGISYGGTTSIHLAAIDRRVRAVVAVEPFATAREVVPHFGRVMVPGLGWIFSDATYQESLNEAGRIAHFDPDEADAVKAIRRTTAPVLLVHGTNDWVVPHQQSEKLHAAAKDHSQLVSVPSMGHIALYIDPGKQVAKRARDWFDRWLSAEKKTAMDQR
jgi:pimeloyl-ACP methyl ester carboxylesterase